MQRKWRALSLMIAVVACSSGGEQADQIQNTLNSGEIKQLTFSPLGHCAHGEATFFTCTVSNGKTLSICGSTPAPRGWLQYRFGALDNIEFAFPEDRNYTHFSYNQSNYVFGFGFELSFENAGFEYRVWDQSGAAVHNGHAPSGAGIIIGKNNEHIGNFECSSQVKYSLPFNDLSYVLKKHAIECGCDKCLQATP
jgi:hypothetical protein